MNPMQVGTNKFDRSIQLLLSGHSLQACAEYHPGLSAQDIFLCKHLVNALVTYAGLCYLLNSVYNASPPF